MVQREVLFQNPAGERECEREMAKVGEGDERWIVEERKDGRNVNGWHWEEKNALSWSRDTIQKLLLRGKRGEEAEVEEATARLSQFCIEVKGDGDGRGEETQRLGVTGLKEATGDVRTKENQNKQYSEMQRATQKRIQYNTTQLI